MRSMGGMSIDAELRAALADRYRLDRELGRGATAVVYLAHDLRHGRDVAIKFLHPELTRGFAGDRFLREIRISAALQHPHILSLHDSGEAAGSIFCVMAYVPGETLRAKIARERALPIDEAIALTRQIAEALTYAHQHGVVHRDIKPENILLDGDSAFVADFGIAHSVATETGERLTMTGTTLGTPHYMSPEQAAGERNVDGRSDLYSLACVTYEMLTGEPPFNGPNAQALIARHLQQPPPPLRMLRQTVPEHVEAAVQRALAKSPADRYRDPLSFAAALELTQTRPTPIAPPLRAFARSRARAWSRLALAGAAVAVLAAGANAAWDKLSTPALDDDLLAVAPFDVADVSLNSWREGIADLLAQNLNGAGPLRVVPPSQVIPDWDGRADEYSAVALGRKNAARTSIVGAVGPSGTDSVRLTAAIYDVGTRRLLGDLRVVVPAGRVEQGADSLTVAILGVLARERPLGATRPPSAGTSAMAALKAYLQGEVALRRMDWDGARSLYERAAQLDTGYAMAYHRLSMVRSMRGSGIDSLIWFNGLRAGRLNRGLPERDSLMLAIDSLQAATWFAITATTVTARDSLAELLKRRLFETHDVATRRYAGDAEHWYRLAVNLGQLGGPAPDRAKRTLEALDRSISLDSTLLPAYTRAINLAATLKGEREALRYLDAFIARAPDGPAVADARLKVMLLDPVRASGPEGDSLLATTSPARLLTAWSPLLWSYDSAQTAVRVARRILSHPDAAQLDPRGLSYPQFLLSLTLASRGQVREACATMTALPHWILLTQLALLDCAPADSLEPALRVLAQRVRVQPGRAVLHLPWYHRRADGALLQEQTRLGDSIARAGRDGTLRAAGRVLATSSRGWLALAAGDSAAALARFLEVPDSLCQYCDAQRLVKARLLEARGRDREALAVLGGDLDGNNFPLAFVLRLQRGRVAARLGEVEMARDDFSRVARAWAPGDPALRDSAAVARRALDLLPR